MKLILVFMFIIGSFATNAQSIRTECKNAYYATDYVKYQEYTVIVSWEKISDHAHTRLENIIFDNFKVVSSKEISGKTIFKIKENNSTDTYSYQLLLEELKSIPTKVSCTYNI